MDEQSKQIEEYKKQMFVQQIQRYMPKTILQVSYERCMWELLKHLRVRCPVCDEGEDLFTTSGVLPELEGCQTGRCTKCTADFYYKKCTSWFDCFTVDDLAETIKENQANFGKGDIDEETIKNAIDTCVDNGFVE